MATAASVSDETGGLLGLASLLPLSRYGTPHLAQLVGWCCAFVNPFVNGWFLGAYSGLLAGHPPDATLGIVRASLSGADIPVTSPFFWDIVSNAGINPPQDKHQPAWKVTIVTIKRFGLVKPHVARLVVVFFTLLLLGMPLAACYVLDNASGVGSLVYVMYGLVIRVVESWMFVSKPAGTVKPGTRMGLLHVPPAQSSIVLVRQEENAPGFNIEHLAHPQLHVRFQRVPRCCVFVYRVLSFSLVIGWVVFLFADPRLRAQYRNGYIEVATIAIAALAEVVMKKLVTGNIEAKTVRKANAITAVMWLARHGLLDVRGVPAALLNLTKDEKTLARELNEHSDADIALWSKCPKCNREQVFTDESDSVVIGYGSISAGSVEEGSNN